MEGRRVKKIGCGLFSLVQRTAPLTSVSYWCSTCRFENLLDTFIIPLDSPRAMTSWVLCCLLCHSCDFGSAFPRDCFSSHHYDQLTVLGSSWGFHLGLAKCLLVKISWALPLAATMHRGPTATGPKFLASKTASTLGWKVTLWVVGSDSLITCQRNQMKQCRSCLLMGWTEMGGIGDGKVIPHTSFPLTECFKVWFSILPAHKWPSGYTATSHVSETLETGDLLVTYCLALPPSLPCFMFFLSPLRCLGLYLPRKYQQLIIASRSALRESGEGKNYWYNSIPSVTDVYNTNLTMLPARFPPPMEPPWQDKALPDLPSACVSLADSHWLLKSFQTACDSPTIHARA